MIGLGAQYLTAAGFGRYRITAASLGNLDLLVRNWLLPATKQAILGAFGDDGVAVIKATNAYLNGIAASDRDKATALAGFINYNADSAVGICQFFYVPEIQAAADAGMLNVKQLADNSIFVQILHHHVKNGTQMYPNRTAACYNINAELFSITKHIGTWLLNSKYEFLAEEYYTEGGALSIQRRWSQTSNPYTSTSLTGFTNISNGIGIYKYNGSECPIITRPTWWGATGATTAYSGGIPAYNGSTITKGTLDLWIRVG